jgi:hypothetical protein
MVLKDGSDSNESHEQINVNEDDYYNQLYEQHDEETYYNELFNEYKESEKS